MRKNIIITGASSGLGMGMARVFAAKGHNLGLCARRMENLITLQKELLSINPNIKVFIKPLDVNISEDVFTVFNEFKLEFENTGGKLDRVIVNAGIGKGASLGTGYFEQNKLTAMTNFVAALAQLEAAMEMFRKQNSGHLVIISSMSAFRGYRKAMTVYAATKSGLANMAEGLRVDLLNSPIKVSTVYPGYIRTEINAKVKNVPFLVELEEGCQLLVKAIGKEKNEAIVPFFPWFFLKKLMPFFSLKMMKKVF